jgi:uncharacterized protein YmfQ (DUF2313 family)
MSRAATTICAELLSLMPPGWANPRDPASDMANVSRALATGVETVEALAESLFMEIDPRSADLLLDSFERVLGPDPCGRWELVTAKADRRLIAYQRWVSKGGSSAAYFIALAAALGVTATIDTDTTTCAGAECGSETIESPEQYVWRINLPATQEVEAETGELETGDLLGWLIPSLVECVIRRYAPAHTIPVISYL